jgi:sulfite reductase (NADPH) hemoprotein beta-component
MASKPKAKPHQHPVVITANLLRNGRAVWLKDAGEWTDALEFAAIFEGEPRIAKALETALDAERHQLVVAPYEVEVIVGAGGPSPISQRERIRAVGPSVRADLVRPPHAA